MPTSIRGFVHERRRWVALIVVCFAMLMNTLDQTIVNVALPTIQRDLHFTQASLAWVIDAYLITFAGALLLAGRLGDLIGRKRVFLVGVALFTLASAACGAADTQALLIGARFAQGLGAALSSSVILAIIVADFPVPAERAKAMSSYILVAIGGGSLGLLVGGYVTQALSWHWIFFINLPIGIVTFVLGMFLLDENAGIGIRAGLDVGGALLSTGGMMLAVYAIVTSSQYGWRSSHTLGFAAGAFVVLGAFVLLESRLRHPMMPLGCAAIPGSADLEPGPRIDGDRHVQHVLHRRALFSARSGIRSCRHRSRLPASDPHGGRDVQRADRGHHEEIRAQTHGARRAGRGGRRTGAVRHLRSPYCLLPPDLCGRPADRLRGGHCLHAAVDHCGGVRPSQRCGHRFRNRQRVPAGGSGALGGHTRGRVDRPHRLAPGLGEFRSSMPWTVGTVWPLSSP